MTAQIELQVSFESGSVVKLPMYQKADQPCKGSLLDLALKGHALLSGVIRYEPH